MLVEDFDEFMDEPQSTRRAVHCAVLAYHLHDWVWGGWLKHDKAIRESLGIRDIKDFLHWIDQRCVWFGFVQEIVNGTKHFRATKGFETARVVAAPFAFDQLTAGFDEGAWNGPIRYTSGDLPVGPNGKGCLILDLGDPTPTDFSDDIAWYSENCDDNPDIGPASSLQYLPAVHLLEVVVRFWRNFFKLYRPSAKVPSSKHHVI
jgi:hypothetical protein